jgi:hypothetical protein
MATAIPALDPRLLAHLARLFPDLRLVSVEPLGPDTGATAQSTEKSTGYGLPMRLVLADPRGQRTDLVYRTASANEFGHDRRSDRAAGMIQAYDDFAHLPRHVEALDLGVVQANGELVSIRGGRELYLITTYARGTIYAHDLRRIARDGVAGELDLARTKALARYLSDLHTPIPDGAVRYRRAIRDLVGSGEGIYGIVDGYPPGAVSAERLRAIEERCAAWRWRLGERADRLTRTHGDFHPFNVVFGEGTELTLLDASRGACGDPADDLTAMSVNYILFALDLPNAWRGLGPLWRAWWQRYRDDADLLAAAPPFFAWRALVVCNPRFYPHLSDAGRDRLLGLVERFLDAHRLDPRWPEELF